MTATYAQLAGNMVRDLIVLDSPPITAPGDIYSYVDVTNVSPQPATGWTTPDGGATWQPPTAPAAVPAVDWPAELTENLRYLAVLGPSDEDDAQQIAALTRQVTALIVLVAKVALPPPSPPQPPTGLH